VTAVHDLDARISELGSGSGSLVIASVVALLLGCRHATDPDHLTALSALVLSDDERGIRRAGRLGLAWGSGHAVTLVVLGLPVVLFNHVLPEWAQRTAEGLIGMVVAILALRLLVRWRRGYFHAHPHEHGAEGPHVHVHVHEHDDAAHEHAAARAHDHPHAEAVGRSPRMAFGVGLLHGAGGSAGVGILLIAGIDSDAEATLALVLFAAGTAISMALVSAGWGRLLLSGVVERRLAVLVPCFGTAGLAFGCWYGLGAVG
jgi:ABC-type nickel/cobalt efflux system permease component RcnA